MSSCPECRSAEIYYYKEPIASTTYGGELLPKLGSSTFSSAKMLPVVCAACGYMRFFASDDARGRLRESKHWRRA